jgi:hypothetical protein
MKGNWRTLTGVPVADVVAFVRENAREGQAVHVGTDSLQLARHTRFVTVVAILTPGRGGRAIWRREVRPRIASLRERLLREVWLSVWTALRELRVDVVDARGALFEHEQLAAVLALPGTAALLEPVSVEAGHVGLLFRDGRHEATLAPGAYALWKGVARAKVVPVDLREQVVDVAGQEIMTADKVTLRMNAVVRAPGARGRPRAFPAPPRGAPATVARAARGAASRASSPGRRSG